MIPSIFSDIAPKALLAAVAVWAGANYIVIGPDVASRVVRADYLPICEGNFKAMVAAAGEERERSLAVPSLDAAQEFALSQLDAFQNNPMMGQLRGASGPLGTMIGDMLGIDRATAFARQQYEDGKRAARAAYNAAQERIRQETATTLGKAGNVCGCVADAAIADTLTDWAIYSGTLTFIKPASIKAFDQRMRQVFNAGACGMKGGA